MSRLDALHAEMLGDLQEVHSLLAKLHADIPTLVTSAKKESDEAAEIVKQACIDFQAQAFALAEFIKLRKAEVLQDIEQSTARNAITTKRALSSLRYSLWLIWGLVGTNLALTVALALGAFR